MTRVSTEPVAMMMMMMLGLLGMRTKDLKNKKKRKLRKKRNMFFKKAAAATKHFKEPKYFFPSRKDVAAARHL